ncbi:MAG: hypothetical protein KGL50_04850, partial [Burkholderiales bacterium]|nr:hypothetical protein [Burkholderiales bacterium]
EARRLAAGAAVVERSRRLGAYLQARGGAPSRHPHERSAEAVLRQTAIDPRLFDPESERSTPEATAAP